MIWTNYAGHKVQSSQWVSQHQPEAVWRIMCISVVRKKAARYLFNICFSILKVICFHSFIHLFIFNKCFRVPGALGKPEWAVCPSPCIHTFPDSFTPLESPICLPVCFWEEARENPYGYRESMQNSAQRVTWAQDWTGDLELWGGKAVPLYYLYFRTVSLLSNYNQPSDYHRK